MIILVHDLNATCLFLSTLSSMVSLTSMKPQEEIETEESEDETSFSDATGTPPPKIKHRHAARADEVCELFEKVSDSY